MSVHIAWDPQEDVAVLYESTTGFPLQMRVFVAPESFEDAERFLEYLGDRDPRLMSPRALEEWRHAFEALAA